LAVGYWNNLEDIEGRWQLDREALPDPSAAERISIMRRDWKRAVERSLDWARDDQSCSIE